MKDAKKDCKVLAFDFGASSGRGILGRFCGGELTLEEIHRFDNVPVETDGALRWNFDELMRQVHVALDKAGPVDAIGFDTWGVDFGLIGRDGKLLELPVHYRDGRTEDMPDEAFARMSPDELYGETGNQIMAINTLFQLLSLKKNKPALLEKTKQILMMPDLFAYSLCGRGVCEKTIASTTQMLSPLSGKWSNRVLGCFGIDKDKFAQSVDSGSIIGTYKGAAVISVAGHDTQCAVAAMPVTDEENAFLSCGTWSLLGCELTAPVLSGESRRAELSNELGANGKVNYLKNIIGLWLIQESRRQWKREGKDYSYAELEALALESEAFQCFIDPDDPLFTPPGDLPGRIRDYCLKTGQKVPESVGEIMRCIYESLALKYSVAVSQLQQLTGKHFTSLNILGGGTKDRLLCKMTADCTGLAVTAGPVEATALGNIIIQLTALGALDSLDEGRKLIAKTQPLKQYQPENTPEWEKAKKRYDSLLQYTNR
ncbi:MAG: rhamnulokinase family protein [Acutalibacteraceae bacterium]